MGERGATMNIYKGIMSKETLEKSRLKFHFVNNELVEDGAELRERPTAIEV